MDTGPPFITGNELLSLPIVVLGNQGIRSGGRHNGDERNGDSNICNGSEGPPKTFHIGCQFTASSAKDCTASQALKIGKVSSGL